MIHVTHFGTATVLLEIFGLRLLTDPAFDARGSASDIFGIPGTTYTKLEGTTQDIDDVLPIDVVLLTHDQHLDNLDHKGRTLLPHAKQVYTTVAGAGRLRGNSIGMRVWDSVTIPTPEGPLLKITATPARHGPPLSRPLVGTVIGFFLEWEVQAHGGVYISGDTVRFKGIADIAKRYKIHTALLHIGAATFRPTGNVRYSFTANEASAAAALLNPKQILPIHYQDWSHFAEGRAEAERAFADAGLSERTIWLTRNKRTAIAI